MQKITDFTDFNRTLDEAKAPLRDMMKIGGEVWYGQLNAFMRRKSAELGKDTPELQALAGMVTNPLSSVNYLGMTLHILEKLVDNAKDTASFSPLSPERKEMLLKAREFVATMKPGALQALVKQHDETMTAMLKQYGEQQTMAADDADLQFRMLKRYGDRFGLPKMRKEDMEAYSRDMGVVLASPLGKQLVQEFVGELEHYAIQNKDRLLALVDSGLHIAKALGEHSIEAKADAVVEAFVKAPPPPKPASEKPSWAAQLFQQAAIESGIQDARTPEERYKDEMRYTLLNAMRPLGQLGSRFVYDLAAEGIAKGLEAHGIPMDKSHYEAGISVNMDIDQLGKNGLQHETSISHEDKGGRLLKPTEAMKRLRYARFQVVEQAEKVGLRADFSPLPTGKESSSGMHVHFDLREKTDPSKSQLNPQKNGFGSIDHNPTVDYLERGQIAVLGQAMYALAPSEKALKRYRVNPFAPDSVAARKDDKQRNAIRRIITGETQHLECRLPASDAEPYMMGGAICAGMLHGLEGMTVDTKLPVPVTQKLLRMLQRDNIRLSELADDFREQVQRIGRGVIEANAASHSPNLQEFAHELRKAGLNVPQAVVQRFEAAHKRRFMPQMQQEFVDMYAQQAAEYAQARSKPLNKEQLAMMWQKEGIEASVPFLVRVQKGVVKPGALLHIDKQTGLPIPEDLGTAKKQFLEGGLVREYMPRAQMQMKAQEQRPGNPPH
ncbi:MAG: hypothetical protein EBV03_05735 [Proteobacteria bacterium]|nr:hypothetical protein [Pseudomonadota bacterium]